MIVKGANLGVGASCRTIPSRTYTHGLCGVKASSLLLFPINREPFSSGFKPFCKPHTVKIHLIFFSSGGLWPRLGNALNGVNRLQGLDTAAPRLQLADGSWLAGQYETSVGSTLLLTDETQQAEDGHTGGVRYLCHTERRLVFRK